jgi:hypothetical protein
VYVKLEDYFVELNPSNFVLYFHALQQRQLLLPEES